MRFEILRDLGEGGFGSVYRAIDHATNDQVAIKMVPSYAGDPPYLTREFAILSALSHPNIVRVIDKFYLDGRLCFAMELIDGVTLPSALEREPRNHLSSGTRHLFGQLHDALDYIHDYGLVHAELSPDNMLVSGDGTLKLIDFEHARWIDRRDKDLWPAGVYAGTPRYSSPEHFTSEALGPEADYFVVGILLAEHLVGNHPFGHDLVSTITRIASCELAPTFAIETIESEERDVVVRLLSRDRGIRKGGWDILRTQLGLEKGAGPVIRNAPARTKQLEASVFISHASSDKPVARRLARELADRGITVWLDEWRIKAGESITKSIDDALSTCQFVILLLSPQALRSPWVEREWRAAYWREIEHGTLHLIPAMVSDCQLPALLRDKKYVDLDRWDEALVQLIDVMAGA